MCSRLWQRDPKARRMMAIANFSLAVGLLVNLFVHPAARSANYVNHFVSGLLIGVSLAINLRLLWLGRRCGQNQS
jgi:hypothetical protein